MLIFIQLNAITLCFQCLFFVIKINRQKKIKKRRLSCVVHFSHDYIVMHDVHRLHVVLLDHHGLPHNVLLHLLVVRGNAIPYVSVRWGPWIFRVHPVMDHRIPRRLHSLLEKQWSQKRTQIQPVSQTCFFLSFDFHLLPLTGLWYLFHKLRSVVRATCTRIWSCKSYHHAPSRRYLFIFY